MNAVVTISVLLGLLTYTAFLVFCILYWIRGVTGLALLLAGIANLIWLTSPLFTLTRDFYLTMEPLALWTWSVLLVRALGLSLRRSQPPGLGPVIWTFSTLTASALVATLSCFAAALGWAGPTIVLIINLSLLVVNVLGLVLVEQLAQNSVSDFRWRIRYMNIGLGMMFTFGMVHHALAILFDGPVLILSAIQPAVMASVVPFVIVASLRNRTHKLRFSLSRDFVFRTGVLVSTGFFLLLLGLFGYLAQIFAGDIGLTVAVFVALVAGALFLVVVGSSRFRSQLRVQLAKTFFEYRYDYRDEWMKVTAQLTEPDADFDLPQQAQRAVLNILNAKCACLWIADNNANFRPISNIEANQWLEPLPRSLSEAILAFYSSHDWVLDLNDMPEAAQDIQQFILDSPIWDGAGYIVPLFVENRLFGLCIAGKSEIPMQLTWEDYDIIKLISKQSAGFLALQEANKHLVETEQLSAVNQMTAFLLHDIKTITAQLSLMLENAPKHRDNPAFIDDMLATTKNSVQRMERIITGLRKSNIQDDQAQRGQSAESDLQHKPLDLTAFLQARQHNAQGRQRNTTYQLLTQTAWVDADSNALETAITHLENNAIEAAGETGHVEIRLASDAQWATLAVIDDGHGMEDSFIRNELFTPFRSTKGLTGMGIGAYQARDKIRACGGDLQVESKVAVGTTFTIKLPLVVS